MMRRFRGNWKLVVLLLLSGCRSEVPRPQPHPVVVWKPIGSWSGRGDKQTETFTGDTGGFRGTEDVAAERPRWYYLTIESANVDWTVSVDERIDAQTPPAGR